MDNVKPYVMIFFIAISSNNLNDYIISESTHTFSGTIVIIAHGSTIICNLVA